jgi:RNA polymerase sigma-70 factor (ECF subfamily)
MAESELFADFLRRIRAGDERAAAELVERYEPLIRRSIRLRLTDPSLARLVDTTDICQSVLGSFFVRAAAGEYELNEPGQLVALLTRMARNKLASQARRNQAQRRDGRRRAAGDVNDLDPAGTGTTPSRVLAARDLLDEVRRRLGDEERRLADLRAQGMGWAEVAAAVGGTPDGRRMQLTRALDRVTQELGLDESDYR